MERHDEATKEWGALGSWALVPSTITYEPKINISILQGESTRDGARQNSGAANDGTDAAGEAQGCRETMLNGAAILVGQPGQVQVTAEPRADVDAYSLWKRGVLTHP